jgi:hypothetical protein
MLLWGHIQMFESSEYTLEGDHEQKQLMRLHQNEPMQPTENGILACLGISFIRRGGQAWDISKMK